MCLAIPGKVVKIEDDVAIIDYDYEKRKGKIMNVVPKVGDYVIVQAGFILDVVDKKKAEDMKELLNK